MREKNGEGNNLVICSAAQRKDEKEALFCSNDGGENEEPASDPTKVKVFNSLLPGDTQPYPPVELSCQSAGIGKVPLTKEGLGGRHLYVSPRDLGRIKTAHNGDAKHYVQHLCDALLGAKGVDFAMQRKKQRRIDVQEAHSKLDFGITPPIYLLTKDFLSLIESKFNCVLHCIPNI